MGERGEKVNPELLTDLYKGRGKILRLNQNDKEAAANYEEMRAEGVKRQSKSMELSALIFLSNLHSHYTRVFNPSKAKETGRAALALAQEIGDRAAQAHALWGLQNAELYSAGDSKMVVAYGQEALALARELGLKELIAHALKNLSWPFGAQKNLEQAREELAEAQSIWQELGNLRKLAEAYRLMLMLHSLIGDHRSMLVDAPKLIELGASIGSRLDEVEPLYWLASVQIRQGRFGQALENLEQVRAYVEALGHPKEKHDFRHGQIVFYLAVGAPEEAERWAYELYAERETVPPNFITHFFVEVARTKIALGKLEEGREILDELLAALPYDAPWSFNIIDIALGYGRIHLALGQPENLFAGLEERMQPYREAGFGRLLADEYWLRGRAALALGQVDAAREWLLKARGVAEAQEERAILWKIMATTSEVEKASGNMDLADSLCDKARAVVEDIAAHAGEMRDTFLKQPAIVHILGETYNR
jgi:tetratricopeptide (TPR) repeat protein